TGCIDGDNGGTLSEDRSTGGGGGGVLGPPIARRSRDVECRAWQTNPPQPRTHRSLTTRDAAQRSPGDFRDRAGSVRTRRSGYSSRRSGTAVFHRLFTTDPPWLKPSPADLRQGRAPAPDAEALV